MVEKQYGCPVEVTLDVIGGKWKCVILWWLRRGARRFGELMQLMPGVSQKVLTTQLRQLEADGLVNRQVFQVSPRRVEYSLTTYGETLKPITDLMCEWGKAHAPGFQFGLKYVQGQRILVVAKEIVGQRLEAELGELRGADVTATSLVMTLEDLSQLQPDIVLLDFSLNENFSLLKQRLETVAKESQKPIPTIALIANIQARDRALSQGFHTHLMEPVEISELIAEIASLTGRLE